MDRDAPPRLVLRGHQANSFARLRLTDMLVQVRGVLHVVCVVLFEDGMRKYRRRRSRVMRMCRRDVMVISCCVGIWYVMVVVGWRREVVVLRRIVAVIAVLMRRRWIVTAAHRWAWCPVCVAQHFALSRGCGVAGAKWLI